MTIAPGNGPDPFRHLSPHFSSSSDPFLQLLKYVLRMTLIAFWICASFKPVLQLRHSAPHLSCLRRRYRCFPCNVSFVASLRPSLPPSFRPSICFSSLLFSIPYVFAPAYPGFFALSFTKVGSIEISAVTTWVRQLVCSVC